MKKTALILIAFLSFNTLFSQRDFTPGKWTFQPYSPEILKVTFQPEGYLHNENITGAVITTSTGSPLIKIIATDGEASANKAGAFQVDMKGNRIYIQKEDLHLGVEYRDLRQDKGFTFSLMSNEKIFGGGERAIPLDRRGHRINLYNNPWYGYSLGADNLNYSVPFITSSAHYALFFDNASTGWLDIGRNNPDELVYGARSGELNFYIITGKDYPQILKNYHSLTGTQPLPPRWAMGSFMSRFGYTSQKQANEIYKKMNNARVPFDAVIFDLFWFGDSIKNTLGNLDWVNKTKWPDPKKMISDFTKDGVQTILVTEPFILENSLSYEKFKPYLAVDSAGNPFRLTNFYFGYGGLVDIFNTQAMDLFWSYYKKQMNIGVEAWWGDLGEPEKHPSGIYHRLSNQGYKRLFAADEVHNVYGHNWTKMLFEKFAVEYPNKRLFSLNRSGFAGTQRYGIFPWSGDVSRNWSGLQAQLPLMLGMSMSGVPYIHADAGGFAGGEGDWELYLRWLQFAQFTPIFRPHGTALYEVDPNAFSFPSEIALADPSVRELARNVAVSRYHMLPYNYTLSYRQASIADPLVSPLYYYYGNDTSTYHVGDEFMWGKDILVAPVLEKRAKERKVYLPAGEWYKWNEDTRLKGGKEIIQPLILASIPVFVKAGSLIPLVPEKIDLPNTSYYNTAQIEWHYYNSDQAGTFELFDDDGSSKNSLASNNYEIITAKAIPTEKGRRFEFSSNNGIFAGKPAVRKFAVVIHGMPEGFKLSADPHRFIQSINSSDQQVVNFEFSGGMVSFELVRQ